MTKTELVAAAAKKSGLTQKDTDKALAALLDAVTAALAKGDKVQLTGFGTFEVREKAAREGRNPRTGETIAVPASKAPAFKAGASLKKAVK
ncbi:MAG: HU family DNA-binding protein [Clostridia bacterium]|nr:HU family DNA-binding protein [Clostridia bacterium]MBQ9505623.1 HU family DNA-binding protein [Clostridia bacterium]MBR5424576.1 HU family DNA-binding protein [Clostridia bacterium]